MIYLGIDLLCKDVTAMTLSPLSRLIRELTGVPFAAFVPSGILSAISLHTLPPFVKNITISSVLVFIADIIALSSVLIPTPPLN